MRNYPIITLQKFSARLSFTLMLIIFLQVSVFFSPASFTHAEDSQASGSSLQQKTGNQEAGSPKASSQKGNNQKESNQKESNQEEKNQKSNNQKVVEQKVIDEKAGNQQAVNQDAKNQATFKLLNEGKRQGLQQEQQDKTYKIPEKPTVYLTFDDGPSKLTGPVLDLLQKENIKASFFVLGKEAQAHPELIRRIINEGHTIGNHSYDHIYKELYSDFSSFWEQLQRTEQILNDTAGVKPRLVRAPGGTFTNFDAYYYYYMDQAGYTVVDWNVDSGDSRKKNVPKGDIIEEVKKAPLKHEMTVLFHDGSGHEATLEALPEVIRYFKNKGYAFAPLSAEVKPVQFPLGKSKWNRTMSYAHFQELLTEVAAYAHLYQSEHAQQSGQSHLAKQVIEAVEEDRAKEVQAKQAEQAKQIKQAEQAKQTVQAKQTKQTKQTKQSKQTEQETQAANQTQQAKQVPQVQKTQTQQAQVQIAQQKLAFEGNLSADESYASEAFISSEMGLSNSSGEELLAWQGRLAIQESEQALAVAKGGQLTIKLGNYANQSFILEPDQYQLKGDRIQLSLRFLMEGLGAEVSWEQEKRTAWVHFGLTDISFDVPSRTIQVYKMGVAKEVYYLAELNLIEGVLQVPLTSTLALLGGQVTGFNAGDGPKEVAIDMRKYLFI
ncbi:polysaccharide deacetylase [Paenibacillus eucommiae]|uniref:Peptidoglycan/xylan/chitin deacetylase (PgdA/CDA1 family) n=1 Tax=Paenibacillus eucommiae TaxID=1355755 RepID=A0ABS4IXK9_9BACL|nr:polysaccharide deacetylase [Paenibacillus eucommiae]MBP1992280.1 peptidoglycan/xylan/chitin deacetylase (PgdA/CDA1 family) [Paenibacillus eucommiae]